MGIAAGFVVGLVVGIGVVVGSSRGLLRRCCVGEINRFNWFFVG